MVATATLDNDVSCNGGNDGEATAAASGGTATYSYSWNTGATTATASGLTAGIYTVTATDANGCTATDTVQIDEPTVVFATVNLDSNVSCNGGNDGSLTASGSGGTPGYTFLWNNGTTTATASGLIAGLYTVTVTDANGCTNSDTLTITEPDVLVASTTVDTNVSCNGGNNGSATASAVGGTTTYSFVWTTGATTATATNLTAGTYTVTVTDANSCTDTETVTITEPVVLSITSTVINNVLCNGETTGSAFSTATGGTTPYTFSWSNGTVNDTAMLAAGTWSAYVTDTNGCIDSTTVTITESDSLLIVLDSIDDVSCNGLSDGAITLHATGGTTTYSYSWSNGATTASIAGVPADTYSLTVTDANGCQTIFSDTVSEPDTISNFFIKSDVSCNSGNDGYLIVNPSGGTPGYTSLWNTGATTDSIGGLVIGQYTVTVTDANGCQKSFTDSISQPDSLLASIILEDSALCAGDSSGMAVAMATGGTTPYTYSWPAGFTASNDTLSGLPAGTYMVTITDDNGCMDSALATINQPAVLALTIDSTDDVTCEGGNDGFALISAAGGTTPYSYSWPNGGTNASNGTLTGGSHTVTVTDANGCLDTITVTLGETYPLPVVNLGADTIVCGAVYNLGAGAATTYLWSTGDTTQSILVDTSNYYSVIAGDTNGCQNSDTVLVIFNPLLSYTVDSDSSDCGLSTGSAEITNLTGGGNYSVNWSNGQTSGLIANNLSSGNYMVTVTDQNGCMETQGFSVYSLGGFTSSVSVTDPTCNGGTDGSAVATATGGLAPYSYEWPNGTLSDTVTGLGAGTYLVTIEDANGCLGVDTAIIGDPDSIVVFATTAANATCGDSNGTGLVTAVMPTGTYTYQWSDGLAQTTIGADSLAAGIYTVTATSVDGCTGVAQIIVTNTPSASLATTTINANCSNELIGTGSAIVTATGTAPFDYSWSNGDTTDTVNGLVSGIYYVSVSDSSGCVNIATVSIDYNNIAPSIDLGADVEICGNIYGIGVGAGYANYAWSTLDSTSSILVTTSNTYTVIVTDSVGCSAIDSVAIDFTDPLTISSTITDADCGSSNGAISVTVANGSGNYTYLWNTGDTTSSLSGLAAGTYVISVSDTTICDIVDTIVVGQVGAPVVTITTIDPICADGADGEATAVVTGGASPYDYAWSNGGTGTSITSLTVGLYDLTVTDDDGCEVVSPFTVSGPAPLTVSIMSTEPSCTDSNGSALATVTGNQGMVTYLWSDSNATDSMFVDSLWANVYQVTVTDSAGCSVTESLTLNNEGAPILILGTTDNVCSNDATGTAFVIPFGFALPNSYLWNDAMAQTNDTATNLGSGTYVVSVTDTNGCTSIGSTVVGSFNTSPIVSLGDDITACDGSEVILTPGGQFSSYAWNTTATTNSVTATASQTYIVTVTDINGCSGLDSALVTFVTPPVVDLGPDTVVCTDDGGTTLTLDAGAFSTYDWSTSETTQTIEITSGGTYGVTVSDIPECAGSDEIIVVFDNCVNVSAEEIAGQDAPGMNIFPNPNRGQFTVETTGLEGGKYQVQLMAINGQIVMNNQIAIQTGVSSRDEIDLRDIDRGVYILVIQGETVRMDTRVIIQ